MSMREVNNQQPSSSLTPAVVPAKVEKENLKDSTPIEPKEAQKEINDLGNMPAETLGRSQVAAADSIEKDVKFMLENPDAVEQADKFFQMAEKVLASKGDKEAYEKAALLTDEFKKEFLSK